MTKANSKRMTDEEIRETQGIFKSLTPEQKIEIINKLLKIKKQLS